METKIFNSNEIEQAVKHLEAGELIAFPTETVYGLGADATNAAAVAKVYEAKGRPSDNPLIVTVADEAMMAQYALEIPLKAQQLIDAYWPGPLTILLNVKPNTLPTVVTGGLKTVAFRNPADELTRQLIEKLGRPIVGPSANTSTKPSPTTASHVYHDLRGKIAGIIDGGTTEIGLESTIVDLTVEPAVILRPGQITPAEISAVIGETTDYNHNQVGAKEVPKAPGMKYRHYAPKAQVVVVDRVADFAQIDFTDPTVALVALAEVIAKYSTPNSFSLGESVATAAHNLFAALRFFDDQPNIKTIYVQGFKAGEIAPAYMNRLNKSAAGKHFNV